MKFSPGSIVITPGAEALIQKDGEKLAELLTRHLNGDWGDMVASDKALNDDAITSGDRIMSAYVIDGEKVWVITESDRSVTTVLLPDEY